MPITLNHSNIGVQYSTGSNYLIETVKSDVFVPVPTPMTTLDEPTATPNRFVVQSFTYNGTGDFTPHTFNFPVNTLCDILIVGGGGGGSEAHGGGGGAGAVIFIKNVTMNGVYNINVGRGGLALSAGGLRGIGEKGFDSEIIKTNVNKIVAEGGGGGGNNASNGNGGNGGSGGGGDAYDVGAGLGGLANSYTVLFESISGIKYGFNGGRTGVNPGQGAGGGGSGAVGGDAMGGFGTESGPGGNGRKSATIGGIEYDFKTLFGTNVGVLENDNFVYFGGGGGGGRWANSLPGGVGGLGGGGTGGWGRNAAALSSIPLGGKGFDGVNNTGGGGGGGGDNQPTGGKGGSGIVIIRYVAFAIPEGTPTITHKTLNFSYSATQTNTFALTVQPGTVVQINDGAQQLLSGNYTVNVGATQSSVVALSGQTNPFPATNGSSIAIRYSMIRQIPTLDPIGAQWTYNSSNTNVYHFGRVGIGTTSPEYQLDVRGSLNANAYYLQGIHIKEPIYQLSLNEGMIVQVQHLTYTKMDVKNNPGWDAINDDLTTGFVIAIKPKSNLSKILVSIIVHIGLETTGNSVWWGIRLYRRIGFGSWNEVTGSNGTETGSAAATSGTPVWISNTMYVDTQLGEVIYKITNVSGTYLDSPNTTEIVHYTAYWNQRLGDNPSSTGNIFLNRASSQGDAYRPAPSSSWTASEIWYG